MTVTRDDRDIYRLTPSMDAAVLETIAARLEFRGTDEGYARRSQAYFARLPLPDARRILALGCGTGVEVRALRRVMWVDVRSPRGEEEVSMPLPPTEAVADAAACRPVRRGVRADR